MKIDKMCGLLGYVSLYVRRTQLENWNGILIWIVPLSPKLEMKVHTLPKLSVEMVVIISGTKKQRGTVK